MTQIGKGIIVAGAVLMVLGALLWLMGKVGFRGLPGDIRYESHTLSFYFPLATCLAISVGLSGLGVFISWLWHWWHR